METGSNKSLFTLIAVVIFGIFLSLSYYLFQDEMKNVLATVMDKTSEMNSTKLEYDGLIPTNESYFVITDLGNGTCRIDDYKVSESGLTDIVIPKTINNKIVVSVGSKAFMSKGLTSVVLPSTLTKIEAGYDNVVGSVDNYGAFMNNNLTKLSIPSSITYIGEYAFALNKLTNLSLPDTLTFMGEGVFYHNNLTTVSLPLNLTSIERDLFHTNNLISIEIPESVKHIGGASFAENKMKEFTIPSSVTTISNVMFRANPVTTVNIPESLRASVLANPISITLSYDVNNKVQNIVYY